MSRIPLFALVTLLALIPGNRVEAQASIAVQPVKVAFIGDQGLNENSAAVLRLVRDEGADILLHQGDLDYSDRPDVWDAFVSDILGVDFPYLVSAGNHDEPWAGAQGYAARLQARVERIAELDCQGEAGVQSVCRFRGLFFLFSGVGTRLPKDDPAHIAWMREQLAATDSLWRICSWHKNQARMQAGGKRDEVGWLAYETCREGGAIIASAHEHSYARTHLLANFEQPLIVSTANSLVIEKGRTIAFVSGLGGFGIRSQRRSDPWWASIVTSDQQASFGALFCTFFDKGIAEHASCYFKDIDGRIRDRFDFVSRVNTS